MNNPNISIISNAEKREITFSLFNTALTFPAVLWFFQLVLAILVTFIFSSVVVHGPHPAGYYHAWDGVWDLGIAEHGYDQLNKATFYPGFPLLIRFVHWVTHLSWNHSGFLVANIAFLFALVFFYKLILLLKFSKTTAQHSLWLLIAFPTALFFNATYTESLSLLAIVLFFYFLQQDKWYCAMLTGLLSTAVHDFNGMLVVAGLGYLFRTKKQLSSVSFWQRFFSIALIPCGLLMYMAFLWHHFGTPFATIEAETLSWHRVLIIPFTNIWGTLKTNLPHLFVTFSSCSNADVCESIFLVTMDAIAPLLMLILAGIMFSYRGKSNYPLEMKLFFILTLLVSICSGIGEHGSNTESYGRLMLILFPAFIVWADIAKKESIFIMSLVSMLIFKIILQGMFASGYWVT